MKRKKTILAGMGVSTWGLLFILQISTTAFAGHTLNPDSIRPLDQLIYHLDLEYLLTGVDEDMQTSMLEELKWLTRHPINLNTASAEELRSLPMLNDLLITRVHEHIERHGPLVSMHELQSIEGFYPGLIQSLIPFAHVGSHESRPVFGSGTLANEGEHVLFLRYQQLLEEQAGFSDPGMAADGGLPGPAYPGSPYRLYARYRFTWYRHISAGITAEKDPGEEFFKGSQPKGFDFYSAHIFLRDMGRLKTLAIGDFLVQWGQGLSLWTGMGFGKSSQVMGIRKNGSGLRQYTSVDENNFFRGVGSTWQVGPLEITCFWSSKRRDASINAGENGQPLVSGFPQTGLHRTQRELEGKHAVKESTMGAMVSGHFGPLALGVTAVGTSWDAKIQQHVQPYNQFSAPGNPCLNAGVHYELVIRNLAIFGEVASGPELNPSFINGLLVGLHPKISAAILHRQYHMGFQSVSSRAFGEHAGAVNEMGIYVGIEAILSPSLQLTAYADHFQFPWLRYRASMPSAGSDYLLNIDYAPHRQTSIQMRLRMQSKPLNTNNPVDITYLDQIKRLQFRIHFSREVIPGLRLANRIEIIRHTRGGISEIGFLSYQDILYRPLDAPLSLTMRFAMFNTGGHDSRIYAHEHDVLYAFSFPFYSDRGYRFYLLSKFNLHRQATIYARFARTAYINRDHTGSGLDRVEGNKRSEIKIQFRLRF